MYKKNGFTIVELLIVIVVIAILAAISLVVYNGVRERAMNTQLLALVDGYEKALRAYKVTHSTYPVPDANDTYNICLGASSDYPAEPGLPVGTCITGDTEDARVSPTVNSELAKETTGLRMIPSNSLTIGDVRVRGVLYQYNNGSEPSLAYYQAPGRKCGRGEAYEPGPMTICIVPLPN